jgi:hypothetical protein
VGTDCVVMAAAVSMPRRIAPAPARAAAAAPAVVAVAVAVAWHVAELLLSVRCAVVLLCCCAWWWCPGAQPARIATLAAI